MTFKPRRAISNRDYSDPTYRKWRYAVKNRDRKTCRMPGCGSTKKLQVHHVKRWSDAPALRFDVNNGITLCKTCHARVSGHEEHFAPLFLTLIRQGPDKDKKATKNKTLPIVNVNRWLHKQKREEGEDNELHGNT